MTVMLLDDVATIAPDLFANSYGEARAKFLDAAPDARAYPSAATGPAGEALFTDVAYYGPADAANLLILISATHGVEGYCGSAGQLFFLKTGLADRLPPSTAVLIVHALNCYGFAWDRRVTAEGCDLNRNFVDFDQPLPSSAIYEALADHAVPADLSDEGVKHAEDAIAAYEREHGQPVVRQGLTGGQYTVPGGIFYGGSAPTEARRTLEQIAADYDMAARGRVVVLDYHTGLGPYGYGELQTEETAGPDGYDRARAIFGPSVTSPFLGTSSSVVIPGSMDAFFERALGDRHVYLAFEFGTYPPRRAILRSDHWLFRYCPEDADAERGRAIRRTTKAQFYPQQDDWMEMVLCRSHQVIRQALDAFAQA